MTALFRRSCRRGRAHAVAVILAVVAAPAGMVPAHAAGGTVSVEPVAVNEPVAGTGSVLFTVTLARTGAGHQRDGVVTVGYTTADGTATAGRDYVATSGSLDFGPAGRTRTVRVPVLADGTDEDDETFDLRLTGVEPDLAATATIADADVAPRLSVRSTRAVEGDTGTSPAGFAVSLSPPSGRPVSVDYATTDGTAAAPGDFTATSGTLTFEPGQQVQMLSVPVVGDAADESDETFTVTLAKPTNATIADAAAEGTIADDDGAPALSVGDATVEEANGPTNITFRVGLDRPSSQNVTFRVETADGTGIGAATAPADYVALRSTPAQITAGETSVDIAVPVAGDLVHEGTETFSLVLSAPANATLARPVATGTITDNDMGPDLSVADTAVAEGTLVGPNLDFKLTLSVPARKDVTVDYATADGTAIGTRNGDDGPPDERDFTPAAGSVLFTVGQTEKTVTVFVGHDGLAEGSETVVLNVTGASEGIAIATPVATGTIHDDDGPPDELSVTDISFSEGDTGAQGHLFTVTRTRRSAGILAPVTVRFATADGSAGSLDYTARSGVLVFSGSTATQTIAVSYGGDVVDEDDETFTVTLSSPTNAVLVKETGTATILDDDDAPLVSATPVSVAEGHSGPSSGVVAVTLSAASSRPVTVEYSVGGGTATAEDYSTDGPGGPGGTLTFAPGETALSVGFSVIGDTLDEADETLLVSLSNPVNAVFGPDATGPVAGVVTIADDDDAPAVSVGDATVSGAEASGAAPLVFTVTLDRASGQPVTVTVDTADGTAVAPGDYTAVGALVLTIPAGERAATVAVALVDDPAPDAAPSETFTVRLSAPVNATLAVDTATGRIVDDDGPASLSVIGDTVTEGTDGSTTTAGFVVTLSRPLNESATVEYMTADGGQDDFSGAVQPGDYTATSGVLTFDPGETTRVVTVTVAADNSDETDEHLTLVLTNPGRALVDPDPAAGGAAVTIVDDDGPAVGLADITVTEGNSGTGNAVFRLELDAAAAQPVTVAYATANGTAAGGTDFTATSGTVTFPPGETARTVTVPVSGDTLHEGDEAFFLTLAPGAAGGAGATVGDAAGRALITDDDLAQLDIADANILEGDSGTADLTFTVTLSPPSSGRVTVSYASGDQTALAGHDYGAVSGELTFNPGDTVHTVVVPVAGDTVEVVNESFAVALSGASIGARLGRTEAVGTVIDDDGLPDISSPDVTVTEKTDAVASAVFPVRLSGPRSFPVTVQYEVRPGPGGPGVSPGQGRREPPNAASGATDFTAVSGKLTFAPGDELKRVTVAVAGDSRAEADETILLRLFDPSAGTVDDPDALATIVDDDRPGYVLAGTDGGAFTFGGAGFFGSTGAVGPNRPVVAVAAHPSGRGYWMVSTDGGIFAFGAAKFFGSTGDNKVGKPIVGLAPTPTGEGYWMVAADGGIFSFGDARFFGSPAARKLNRPIVGMAATPSGQGYWLVATDGGIFSFGDAAFFGSTGARRLNRPIVGMAATPSGQGYWLVATDGGIFSFGDAAFFGSTGARRLNRPIVGMAATPSGQGYWLVATDGGIFAFGDAAFLGSTGSVRLDKPAAGMAPA